MDRINQGYGSRRIQHSRSLDRGSAMSVPAPVGRPVKRGTDCLDSAYKFAIDVKVFGVRVK